MREVWDGATPDNLFPEAHKGSLDGYLLSKMRLTTARMIEGGSLFFINCYYQFAILNVREYRGGDRQPFCSEVKGLTNFYAYSIGLGGSYGHKFKPVELCELVHFDGVVVKDRVRGGSVGAMYWRWVDGSDYDEVIAELIKHSQWLQIKRTVKLNNNSTSPKRGEPGYDPLFTLTEL